MPPMSPIHMYHFTCVCTKFRSSIQYDKSDWVKIGKISMPCPKCGRVYTALIDNQDRLCVDLLVDNPDFPNVREAEQRYILGDINLI